MRDLNRHLPRLLFFPLSLFWMELIFQWWTLDSLFSHGFLYTALFSLAAGLLMAFLSGLGGKTLRRCTTVVLTVVTTLWFWVNAVYFTIFNSFLALDAMTMAGQAVTTYWREALAGIAASVAVIALLAVPLIVLILVLALSRSQGGQREASGPPLGLVILLCAAITVQALAVFTVKSNQEGVMSPAAVYRDSISTELSISHFGLLTTLRLELSHRIFGVSEEEPVYTPEEPGDETPDTPDAPEEPDIPEPIVYKDNVLEIDFAALAESTDNADWRKLDQWVASRTPTKQHEYTGMFKGKNLIFITAEAFWKYAVHPELTPTLYKLANEGFVFDNFYNPLWWKSTIDGEFVACNGLFPSNQVFSFRTSGRNSMPFCMGNMLRKEGYVTKAYHNNSHTYYDRNISHPNMGYDFYAVGAGLEVKNSWPQSDLEMMEKTIPDALASGQPFHNYYMTISGHMNYNFYGNMMANRHEDEVAHLDMSDEARAYLACNMEFDRAMEYVLKELEAAGQLENTVICVSGDHYPYGMDPATWDELSGTDIDTDYDIFRSTLILWSGDMEEPIHIEKPCASVDILPTLLNLFGLEYDSRLLAGQDILSDAPTLVCLSNRSFITDYGRYNSKTDKFTPFEGMTVPEGYVSETYSKLTAMFRNSSNIVTSDYYGSLEKRIEGGAPWQKAETEN